MPEHPAEKLAGGWIAAGSPRTVMGIYILISFLYGFCLYVYLPTLPTYVQSKSEDGGGFDPFPSNGGKR